MDPRLFDVNMTLLALQETLLGCISKIPGNLIFLVTIFSIIGVGLDQDEYPNC